MYLRKNYETVYYAVLQLAKRRGSRIDFEIENDYTEKKKDFLKSLGIKRISAGGRRKNLSECDCWHVGKAAAKLYKEIKIYLDAFSEQFEQDRKEGKLENICVGEQIEFEFTDTIKVGDLTIPHHVSRDEIVRYHKTRGK